MKPAKIEREVSIKIVWLEEYLPLFFKARNLTHDKAVIAWRDLDQAYQKGKGSWTTCLEYTQQLQAGMAVIN
jgi:hypothetical protein